MATFTRLFKETPIYTVDAIKNGFDVADQRIDVEFGKTKDSIESLVRMEGTFTDTDGVEKENVIYTKLNQTATQVESIVRGLQGGTSYVQQEDGFTWDISDEIGDVRETLASEIESRAKRMSFNDDGLTIGVRSFTTGDFEGMRTTIDQQSVYFHTGEGERVGEFSAGTGLRTSGVEAESVTVGSAYRWQMIGTSFALVYVGGE